MKKKLKLYHSYLNPERDHKEDKNAGNEDVQIQIPNREEWKKHGVYPFILDDSYCLIREKRYPLTEKRGHYQFRDFLTAINAWQDADVSHPLNAKGFRAGDLFFFDTETTGLGSGTGNLIFLLGYAFIDGEEVVVKQHFLPEPGAEVPLYYSFLKSVNYNTLVTYNGKAFDWPVVKTRYTLVREHLPKLPSFGHFDLLHAARRLWKHKLDSVSLKNVEEEILGIHREGDLPGYLAPMIYFDFLESKETTGILEVMKHNEADILSLIILYTHISYQLLGLDPWQTRREQLAVGHWYSSLKEVDKAVEIFEESLATYEGEARIKALHELAFLYKKQGKYESALEAWEEVTEFASGKLFVIANIEMAKILEHRLKDFDRALQCSFRALEVCTPEKQPDIEKRILRLQSKRVRQGNFPGNRKIR